MVKRTGRQGDGGNPRRYRRRYPEGKCLMPQKPAKPGDGSIFPRNGKWAAYVWVLTPTGEKARRWLYGDTKDDIEPAFNELKVQAAKVPIPTGTPSVEEYLTYWLENVIKPNREDNTYASHELSSRLYINPGIGKKKIDPKKLTVRVVQDWLNKLPDICQCCAQEKDAKRKVPRCCAIGECCGDYLSRRTIEGARHTLRCALNHAMREELISRNVATLVTVPKARVKSKKRNSWTVDEARQFLRSSRDDKDPLYPLWVLMLVLGLRRGEVLGLTWETIDESALEIGLEWQLVVASGQPVKHKNQLKTDGSTDVLPLPPICLPALETARENQAKARTDEWPAKCICGEKHQLVFTTASGLPIHPRNLRRSFDSRCKRAGVRLIRLQDTRRTTATLLRELGVHPRVAMQILRHSRIELTMDIYTDVPDPATRAALGQLGNWLDQSADPSHAAGTDATDEPPEDAPETTESE
jgi:integrase